MYSHLAVLNPLYGGVGPYGGGVGFRRSHCRFSAGIFTGFSYYSVKRLVHELKKRRPEVAVFVYL